MNINLIFTTILYMYIFIHQKTSVAAQVDQLEINKT